jgi:bacillithiol biosynthesis cysteine-adding enzyme BshC
MSKIHIAYKNTGYFSQLMNDYLDEKPHLKSFYNRFPKIENFEAQIEEKSASYNSRSRAQLVKSLNIQYEKVEGSLEVTQNLELLALENTYTITTGHQLNLFTGPLYFLYKIISTINLTKELKERYPKQNFVPIYWMASEDHDFEEINYFNFKGKKVQWNTNASGVVGDLSTHGLDQVYDLFANSLGLGDNAEQLKQWFRKAYVEHDNLSDATFYLANELFKNYGLIILDANSKDLKQEFIPYIKQECFKETSYKTISETNKNLESNYNIQVNPRENNFFYIKSGFRERIVCQDERYFILNTELSFTKAELEKEIENYPERFSPNVVLRPLYQEVILPNLCYIGGGGELAYWLQLKENFTAFNVPFPMLLLRNSVLIQNKRQAEKTKKLNITTGDLFLNQIQLEEKIINDISKIEINFTTQKDYLHKQFKELYLIAEQTDASFLGAVGAQERKQIKGLEHLEKRLLKAQKRKLKDYSNRVKKLQNDLFPNQNLQERYLNFSELYLEYGEQLIPKLVKNLEPLHPEFTVLTF